MFQLGCSLFSPARHSSLQGVTSSRKQTKEDQCSFNSGASCCVTADDKSKYIEELRGGEAVAHCVQFHVWRVQYSHIEYTVWKEDV